MFYGIEVKSSGNKPITLDTSLKLTQAVLEPSKNGKKEPVTVMLETDEKKQFILCVLDPSLSWQCPLDLMFCPETELKFSIRGTGTVHLTGYEVVDDMDDFSMSSEGDKDQELEHLMIDKPQNGVNKQKVKGEKNGKIQESSAKKSKANGRVPIKRNLTAEEIAALEDDSDDSDDDEFNLSSLDSDDSDDIDEDEELMDGSLDDESVEDDDEDDDEAMEEDDDDDDDEED